MKWRAFSHMPQWVRLSDWLGRIAWRRHWNAMVKDAAFAQML
jgi:hypothetical protein